MEKRCTTGTVKKRKYAEVTLVDAGNWVSPALELLQEREDILVANPAWELPGADRETIASAGDFDLGYGFSDQVFLARRSELAAPIYDERCLASLRYPTAHIAPTFEQRLDAYMRNHRRLRATYRPTVYQHPHRGKAAYAPSSLRERARRLYHRQVVKFLERSQSENPCRRIYWR